MSSIETVMIPRKQGLNFENKNTKINSARTNSNYTLWKWQIPQIRQVTWKIHPQRKKKKTTPPLKGKKPQNPELLNVHFQQEIVRYKERGYLLSTYKYYLQVLNKTISKYVHMLGLEDKYFKALINIFKD